MAYKKKTTRKTKNPLPKSVYKRLSARDKKIVSRYANRKKRRY